MSRTFEKKKKEIIMQSPEELLIYAKPKMGKTDLVSRLDDCLIVDLEGGSGYVKGYVEQVNNLKELDELLTWLEKENPYKYVAFDTMTKLEEFAEQEATKNYMNSNIGKNFNRVTSVHVRTHGIPQAAVGKPFPETHELYESVLNLPNGAGYGHLRNSYNKWFNRMKALSCRKIFICHIKDKMIETKQGAEISGRDLNLTGKLKSITTSFVDTIGYLNRGEDGNTYLSFVSGEAVAEGSRSKHLTGRNILVGEWDKEKHDYSKVHWNQIYVD